MEINNAHIKELDVFVSELGMRNAHIGVRMTLNCDPIDGGAIAVTVKFREPVTVDGWTCAQAEVWFNRHNKDTHADFRFYLPRGRKPPLSASLATISTALLVEQVLPEVEAARARRAAHQQQVVATLTAAQISETEQHIINTVASKATKYAKHRIDYEKRFAALREELRLAVIVEVAQCEQVHISPLTGNSTKGWSDYIKELQPDDVRRVDRTKLTDEQFVEAVKQAKENAAAKLRDGAFKAKSMGLLMLHTDTAIME